MAESLYLVIPSKAQARTIFQQEYPNLDIRIIIGELANNHINAGTLGYCADGQRFIEIPSTLEAWQIKILNSQYANRLKTKAELIPLLPSPI